MLASLYQASYIFTRASFKKNVRVCDCPHYHIIQSLKEQKRETIIKKVTIPNFVIYRTREVFLESEIKLFLYKTIGK